MDAIYSTEYTFNELNYVSPNVVYISLKDEASSTCGSWLSELPSLPSGWSYHCSATPTNIDGTGWIPIPFSNFPILNIPQLFIDPINKPPYYYSFVVGGSYAVYAQLEDPKNQASKNDQDNYPYLYSAGTDKRLIDQAQGLVGYWPFDEGSGTIAKDYSGNGNDGTIYGGATWTTGKVGGALSFDGVDDYVRVNPSASLDITNNLSVIAIVKVNNFVNVGGIVTYGASVETYALATWVSPNRFAFMSNWPSNWQILNTQSSVNIGTWYHLVGVFSNGAAKIYLNGNLDNSATWSISTLPLSSDRWFAIGLNQPGGWEYFNGLIDEVRVCNRALSDSEIKALYDATK
jgi:hypothetical protein